MSGPPDPAWTLRGREEVGLRRRESRRACRRVFRTAGWLRVKVELCQYESS